MECCVGVSIETVLQIVKLYTVVKEKNFSFSTVYNLTICKTVPNCDQMFLAMFNVP